MEKLVEFLASKIGYTLTVIAGFIVPGAMLIFVWNRDLYIQLDIIKLILVSFGISFILFVPVMIFGVNLTIIKETISKKETDPMQVFLVPISLTVVEMIILMTIKVLNKSYSMVDFVKEFGVYTFWCVAVTSVIAILISLIEKAKKKK